MELKLNARLSAYSKIESVKDIASNPLSIPTEAIDKLFKDTVNDLVTKPDIDTLFPDREPDLVISKDKIDELFVINEDNARRVSYREIDSLFE